MLTQVFIGIHFNPRLREGGDYDPSTGEIYEMISIHASAKEATPAPSLPTHTG